MIKRLSELNFFCSTTTFLFSKWISWTSLLCKTSQGALGSNPITFVSFGSLFDVRYADLPLPMPDVLLKHCPSNLPQTGSLILQSLGASFQTFDTSIAMQLSGTGQTFTSWISDSNLIARSSVGFGQNTVVFLSVAGRLSNNLTLSFVPFISASSSAKYINPPTTGTAKIILFGKGMSVFGISSTARVRLTACDYLKWTSESAIMCKMASGSGNNNALVVSQTVTVSNVLTSNNPQTAYAVPSLKFFSARNGNLEHILLQGSNFAPFNSDVIVFEGSGMVTIESKQTRILLTSDALLQGGKIVRNIQVQIQFESSRFDDVILSLETSPFVGRILLMKSQCFGCVKAANDSGLIVLFSDGAPSQLPSSDCSSGIYLPSIPFSSLFEHTGLLFLQVTTGSAPVKFLSSSITIVQSNINIVADTTLSSVGISWYSDSALEFKIPSIVGKSHTFQAIVDGQFSKAMTGLDYPVPVIQRQATVQSLPITGASNVMIFGSFFGQKSTTSSARIGKSSCLRSLWQSDALITCKSSSGSSIPDLLGVKSTVALQFSSPETLIVESTSPSLAFTDTQLGLPSTGIGFIFTSGLRFGNSQYSPKNRISKSASVSTLWFSDSFVISLVASKWRVVHQLTVSVAKLLGAASFLFQSAQNITIVSADTHFPRSGSSQISIVGAGFMTTFSSVQVRVGESGTTATRWVSDSCVRSQNSRIGLSSTLGVTVTVPSWNFPAFSSDSIFIHRPSTEFYGTYAFQNRSILSPSFASWQIYSVITVQGQNFGFLEAKVFESLSMDPDIGCDSVQWFSDTSLSAACQVNPPASDVVFRMSLLKSSQNAQVSPAKFIEKFLSTF